MISISSDESDSAPAGTSSSCGSADDDDVFKTEGADAATEDGDVLTTEGDGAAAAP